MLVPTPKIHVRPQESLLVWSKPLHIVESLLFLFPALDQAICTQQQQSGSGPSWPQNFKNYNQDIQPPSLAKITRAR